MRPVQGTCIDSGDLVSIHMRSILALSSQIHIYTKVCAIPGILPILMNISMVMSHFTSVSNQLTCLVLLKILALKSATIPLLKQNKIWCRSNCVQGSRQDRKITDINCRILVHVKKAVFAVFSLKEKLASMHDVIWLHLTWSTHTKAVFLFHLIANVDNLYLIVSPIFLCVFIICMIYPVKHRSWPASDHKCSGPQVGWRKVMWRRARKMSLQTHH